MVDTVVLRTTQAESAGAPVPWAVDQLERALAGRGVAVVRDGGATEDLAVEATLSDAAGSVAEETDPESFELVSTGSGVRVRAAHPRGLAYGLTELADRVRLAAATDDVLSGSWSTSGTPATPVRSVLRSFSSDVLDLSWFRDPDFWTGYLDELATQRVNRVQLALGMQYNYSHDPGVVDNYLCFAYPFLVDVPGWDVEVEGVDATERAANLAALRLASDEATRRGIHFQLGLWNHAVHPELGESPDLRYPVRGLTDPEVAAYSAAGLEILLRECPGIAGLTFRVHYEGGVPENGRNEFWAGVLAGVAAADRPLDIDLHAKGVDAALMDAAAGASGRRITLSAKYWAEHQGLPYHQARVRDLERARPDNGDDLAGVTTNARRFTRYGYGDFLATDRDHDLLFRVWPGSQRFLLWADPQVFAGYGRLGTLGGAVGVELCEPLTFRGRKGTGEGPRDLYRDERLHLSASDDWQKYRYEYRLWGRLLYDPEADPADWRRFLVAEHGPAADAVERALAAAGRVLPLVTVAEGLSASNNFYWPEVVTYLPMFHGPEELASDFDTPEPHTWPAASPFDPETFDTTDGFVDDLLQGRASGRRTPIENARTLEQLSAQVGEAVAAARAGGEGTPQLERALVDAEILAALATMYSQRIRAGVEVSLFTRTSDAARLGLARTRLQASRTALQAVIDLAAPVYVDDLAFGDRPTERGHWTNRLTMLDAELEDLDARIAAAGEPGPAPDPVPEPVDPVALELQRDDAGRAELVGVPEGATLRLHARPLDQSESWSVVDLPVGEGGRAVVDLPEDPTARYPLQWYLTLHLPSGAAQSFPGLGPDLVGQPYFVEPADARPSWAAEAVTPALAH
ncbi:hypothetical protein [Microlunatus flavus]|uniref:Glycosyl hydrolase family 20, domain 2 n=1 Tax=Microlunatus flavus TaxID=1036181 RepID=A0A1H9AAP8_9ACTN|nr:hypothetical protein [Microlunatus flavus]SEP73078.1 hypothetical protein SAMN05421756_101517 [Microlunatus flavus]